MSRNSQLQIHFDGIIGIVGNYGSGKTEVAVNLALYGKQHGKHVRVVDLDLVNPYFRTREVKGLLSGEGIRVVLPPDQYLQADLPILDPTVAGAIQSTELEKDWTILDVGGDGVGATVLSALTNHLQARPYHLIQIINMYRPFTDTIEGCLQIKERIETASRLAVTGIAGNTNLIEETRYSDICRGYDFVREVSEKTGLPLHFITIPGRLVDQVEPHRFKCPMLVLRRQMVPPWIVPDGLPGTGHLTL